jgi:hypothetical protein
VGIPLKKSKKFPANGSKSPLNNQSFGVEKSVIILWSLRRKRLVRKVF